ncbi:5-methyltetrahydropteroyltriglutamate--homocysteine S-methyltransferase [Vibrio palustris]|uniref:5-methyltetrahydropteroyltriglutamate--homocysteine methyltransferase n=1 Tax=Vibrio palustris TaxID=1918946 RepID=A0A1R4B6A9_9VIBR|nr:5-methyltetrahydropteroyltriglutamate--homocysteine S-methyltransferase [Vibrio palustris]SJL84448.1 5-methyltetrahydropteroyltriglutamate--homocysteine methyltransferase [Vibrio palustris]
MTTRAPFRSDIVGSFLRPETVHQARRDVESGLISASDLTEIEDQAITELVEQQRAAGLNVVTDGEFRRGFWHIDFLEHLNGIEGYVPESGYNQQFKGKAAPSYNIRVNDHISFNPDHPFLAHYQFLHQLVADDDSVIAKATIPAPTMIIRQEILANDGSSNLDNIYPDVHDFYRDLAKTYQAAIRAFYSLGCRYLQLDDTNWAFLADASKRQALADKGIDADEIAHICANVLNESLQDKPDDLYVTTHVCRGNHASSWLFSGGYEPIAAALFSTNFDGFFLEYDNERAGDFSPLRHWNNQKSRVVLGLVTSKFAELEDSDKIKARLQEATAYIPLENLCLSPQCGFASTCEGNKLANGDQWKKIGLINQIAQEVWGDA